MIEFIKKIDKNFFNSFLYLTKRKFTRWLELNKITDLPENINEDFNLSTRYEFFKTAQSYLQTNRINGTYCEFGCHTGSTFKMALRTIGLPFKPNKINRFYAFDSFEGMPEPEGIDKQKIWEKGLNTTSIEDFKKIFKKDLHRMKIVKGFYNEVLKDYKLESGDKIAIAYIDCDYYSSTSDCLNFIDNKLLHGSLIVFDDWNCYYGDPKRGQRLAFDQFKQKKVDQYEFIDFFDIKSGGKSFIVLDKNKIGSEEL